MVKDINSKGFFKMYWEAFDNDNLSWEAAFFLSYLIETYPIWRDEIIIDGVTYKRIANSRIQEVLNMSSHTIRKIFDELESEGYVKLYRPNNQRNGIRYYDLNVNEDIKQHTNRHVNDHVNDHVKNFNIKETKETKEINISKDISKNTSSDNLINVDFNKNENIDIYKPAPAAYSDTDKKVKSLMSFINSLNYPDDLKDELIKWYMNVAKAKLSISQLKDKILYIENACNHDVLKIKQAVINSYLNNWFGFYPPKSSTKEYINPNLCFTPEDKLRKPGEIVELSEETW